ncbi:hypothetical protein Ddc_13327 [Ditylenchus destructor]|nr:hypothetical protein Ddc_13327 [Ditylenchus destructor]
MNAPKARRITLVPTRGLRELCAAATPLTKRKCGDVKVTGARKCCILETSRTCNSGLAYVFSKIFSDSVSASSREHFELLHAPKGEVHGKFSLGHTGIWPKSRTSRTCNSGLAYVFSKIFSDSVSASSREHFELLHVQKGEVHGEFSFAHPGIWPKSRTSRTCNSGLAYVFSKIFSDSVSASSREHFELSHAPKGEVHGKFSFGHPGIWPKSRTSRTCNSGLAYVFSKIFSDSVSASSREHFELLHAPKGEVHRKLGFPGIWPKSRVSRTCNSGLAYVFSKIFSDSVSASSREHFELSHAPKGEVHRKLGFWGRTRQPLR